MNAALLEFKEETAEGGTSLAQVKGAAAMPVLSNEEKMEQFQQIDRLDSFLVRRGRRIRLSG